MAQASAGLVLGFCWDWRTKVTENRAKLTDRLVAKLPPPEGRRWRITWDTLVTGLGVSVTCLNHGDDLVTGGIRTFLFAYRAKETGQGRQLKIGRAGEWSVAAARERAKELRRIVDSGGDPQGERQAARAAPTVEELSQRYIEEHARPKKRPRSLYEDQSLLRQWVLPELGNRKAHDLRRADIEALHRKISKSTPGRANRMLALVSKMYSLAIRWEIADANPAQGIDKNPEEKRERYLKPDELGALLKALAGHPNTDGANVIRLLLLTGARRGEVLNAEWSQFDLAAEPAIWRKPSSHTKQKKTHVVPLSAPARQLLVAMQAEAEAGEARARALEAQAAKEKHPKRRQAKLNAAARARLRKASPYLFPGHGSEDDPLLNLRRFWDSVVKAAKLSDFRLHDLRHSFASYVASSGGNLMLIGALLGHSQSQTTLRYSHLFQDVQHAATERVGAIISAAAENGKPSAEVKEFPSKRRRK
jgi:integrase